MNDTDYMNIALELAKKGRGFTSPNPMVGALVVNNNQIVGIGYHEEYGKPHAEVNAINNAGENSKGATLYVTLEPCNHTGKTPPCTEKILTSGIKKVVFAMRDPNPSVKGGGNEFLRRNGIEVIEGVCEENARRINEAFIKYAKTKKPFVVLKCAATLDGRIASKTGDAKWISNELSRKFVHMLRHETDAVMVGIGTIMADNPFLTTRLHDLINGKKAKDPIRIVLDTKLSIPETAAVLNQNSKADTLLVMGDQASDDIIKKKHSLLDKGAKIIESPTKKGRIDLDALMHHLGEMKITSVLIEGGSRIIASSLSEKIVDKVLFFYAPKIYGGDNGVPICSGNGPELIADCIKVKDIEVKRFCGDVLIEGYLDYSL